MAKSIRFWEWINDGPVKITLQAGQSLHHSTYQKHDEGFSATFNQWHFDGHYVYCEHIDDGRDCDGRLTTDNHFYFKVNDAQAGNVCNFDASVIFPHWQHGSAEIFDQYAQSMNY